MNNAGTALMGIGGGEGKTKAEDAANAAIASPLLDSPIDKAKGIVFNIIGGNDMSLQEVRTYARRVKGSELMMVVLVVLPMWLICYLHLSGALGLR